MYVDQTKPRKPPARHKKRTPRVPCACGISLDKVRDRKERKKGRPSSPRNSYAIRPSRRATTTPIPDSPGKLRRRCPTEGFSLVVCPPTSCHGLPQASLSSNLGGRLRFIQGNMARSMRCRDCSRMLCGQGRVLYCIVKYWACWLDMDI